MAEAHDLPELTRSGVTSPPDSNELSLTHDTDTPFSLLLLSRSPSSLSAEVISYGYNYSVNSTSNDREDYLLTIYPSDTLLSTNMVSLPANIVKGDPV